MKSHLLAAAALLTWSAQTHAQIQPSATDLWDISQGSIVTGTSGTLGYAGSPAGLFGENGQDFFAESTYTYFLDGQAPGFVNFIEWQTPGNVTLNQVRLFAVGDGPAYSNEREFDQFVLKAKSPGSSTYDLTVLTYTPTHPYTFLDASTFLIVDQAVGSVTSSSFRAEFTQYTSGTGFDGCRIRELDGIGTAAPTPPQITSQPANVTLNYGTPAVFTVEASGNGPFTYQWLKNGSPIQNATEASYRIPAASLTDAGSFSVVVGNTVGSTASQAATLTIDQTTILPSSFDLWDVTSGNQITGSSGFLGFAGTPEGMFGRNGQDVQNEAAYTYFSDGFPNPFAHTVEWRTATAVAVKALRLFAVGDGPAFNNEREFSNVTIRAKSPGSGTFDIVVGTFAPSHPYQFLDASTWAILDVEVPEIIASEFRAEFTQFDGMRGFDGPRIMELDAFGSIPQINPAILTQPASQTVFKNSSVSLTVVARGGGLRYQWLLDGERIRGATSATLVISKAKEKDAGKYTVTVSNSLGSIKSATATLKVKEKNSDRDHHEKENKND